jgi:regulatory protein
LEAEVAVKEKLKVGQELASDQIATLAKSDQFQRCHNTATTYLSYRPRSEYEMRQRLLGRGFSSDAIEAVLKRLREQGLVNDIAFAEFWQDNRQLFSPRSQWLVRLELRQKGISNDVIERVASTISDGDNAYRAATSRAHRLPLSDYESFRRCLDKFLKRRGFGYWVIKETIELLWQEIGGRQG